MPSSYLPGIVSPLASVFKKSKVLYLVKSTPGATSFYSILVLLQPNNKAVQITNKRFIKTVFKIRGLYSGEKHSL
jgi:hypothetical protein